MNTTQLGELILFHRKRASLSREACALLAGVGKTAVYDLEHGKETIRMDTLLKILQVLNIKMQFSSPLMEEYKQKQRECFEQAIKNSQATQEQIDELAREAKSGWWERNKDRFPGLEDV
ncbi:MAG: helix-turn-helix domain-containing protein [Haliscomenobacter sp.]|uniref:helix-turn-helix domain-containing protein n=1 Tax=Haliscomenobacter sp. TaxID=2717303 RepID=UPI0029A24E4D|nr:helix-turn-helix domain-containing protein [Haliscomenobacter sp.]MDX2069997.1 helix-turn-helix domain-containing protein [Haliscomenobacter sp.]